MFARIRSAILIAVSLFAIIPIVSAQGSTATITGAVKDPTGAVIPDASVTVTQTDTNFHISVNAGGSGEFTITNLPVGPYRLKVVKSGFTAFEQTGIVLQVGQSAAFQIGLEVGSEAQSVVVSADAPLVESTDNTLQTTVGDKEVVDLPLNGRNPAALVTTVAGTTSATLNVSAASAASNPFVASDAGLTNEVAISVHGVRAGGTYFSLDGADNVDPYSVVGGPFPNPDATQEFRVATGSETSRYPSAPGGAVDIVTRSGTNAIHGTVFEFARNGFFNAENAILAQPDNLNRNQFGGAAGGPILKDRWFIFGNYQRTNTTSQAIVSTFVPTPQERSGIFTNSSTNQTVQLPISPVAAQILTYIPLANGPNGLYSIGDPISTIGNQWTIKSDLILGQHRLFARYFADHNSQPATGITPGNAFTRQSGYVHNWDSIAGGDTWTSKGGKWLVDTRVSYTNVVANNDSPKSDANFAPSTFGINGVSTDTGRPGFGVFGSFDFQPNDNVTDFPRKNIDVSEDVLNTLGKHQLSFGALYRHMLLNELNTTFRNPAFFFIGVNSLIQYGPLNDNTNADFILGQPFAFAQQDGDLQAPTGNQFGGYVEDKYRITDRFTAIAGLRIDPYFPYTPQAKHIACFIPGEKSNVFTNAPTGLTFPGDRGCEPGGSPNKFGIVEPRVGFAYQANKKGTIALRGGWGMYSMQLPLEAYLGFSSVPFARTYTFIQPFLNISNIWQSVGVTNPFTSGFLGNNYVPPSNVAFPSTPTGISSINSNFAPPNVQQYTLSLQHALTAHDSFELAYAGTHGSKLTNVADLNLPVPSATASTSNEQARRPYQAFQQIRQMRSDSVSSYNGLDLTYRHQTKALTLASAFNWSKCIDENSSPALSSVVSEHGNNPRLTRGLCDFDQNLTWRSTGVWSLPSLAAANRLVRETFGSWTASGLLTIDAGQPFSVTDSSDNSFSGLTGAPDYADRVLGVPLYVNGVLNYKAFTANEPGTYGNSGRNAYRSKSYKDVDLALEKVFKVGERVNLFFRAENFNVLNHANYFAITNSYNGSTAQTFGTYTSAHDPRIMQFSFKASF